MKKFYPPTDDLMTCIKYMRKHKNFTVYGKLEDILFYYVIIPLDKTGSPLDYEEKSFTGGMVIGFGIHYMLHYSKKILVLLMHHFIKNFQVQRTKDVKDKRLREITDNLNSKIYKYKINRVPKHFSITFLYNGKSKE